MAPWLATLHQRANLPPLYEGMGTLWQGLLNSPWLLAEHSEIPFVFLSTGCGGPIPSTPLAYPSGSAESTILSQNPPQFLLTPAVGTVPRNEVERASE